LEGVNVYKAQRDEFELKLQMQLKEQSSIQVCGFILCQSSIQELVAVSNKIKAQYEEEIMRLRRELDQVKRRVPNAPEEMLATATRVPPNLKAKNGRGDEIVDEFMEGSGPKRQKTNLDEAAQKLEDEIKAAAKNQPVTGKCMLTAQNIPESHHQKGDGWNVLYNPQVEAFTTGRVAIDLVHTLVHERYVQLLIG
jgi:hypothetical protein